MSSYLIGRSKDEAAIVVTSKLGRVSRRHAQLRVESDGVIELTDLQSANGTEVLKEGGWRKIAKAQVQAADRVRFGGEVEATVAELLSQTGERPGGAPRAGLGSNPRPPSAAPPLGGFPSSAPTGRSGSLMAKTAGPASANCPKCGSPASGQFCAACGIPLPERRNTGIFKVVAQDILQWGDQRSLFDILVSLVVAPVRTSLTLAQNPSYQGHGALLLVAITLSIIYNRLINAFAIVKVTSIGFLWEQIKAHSTVGKVLLTVIEPETAILLVIYTFFLVSFITSFLVFRDYSSQSHSPRAYLKLCCISSFVNAVLYGIMLGTVPLLLWLGAGSKYAPVSAILAILTVLVGYGSSLYYGFQTHMRFWQISGVRTFRGTLITILLTFFLSLLIYLALVLLFAAVIMAFEKF